MRDPRRFEKGSGVYACRSCGRNTRSTGRGDNDFVRLCVECYELAGEENHLLDTGKLCGRPSEILGLIKYIESKGGNAGPHADVKAAAEAAIAKQAGTP